MIVAVSGKSMNNLNGPKQLFVQIIDPETGKPVLDASNRNGTCGGQAQKDRGVKWLTDYTDGTYACNAQAAKMENDRVVITWMRSANYDYTGPQDVLAFIT